MHETPKTIDALFEDSLPKETDIENILEDDMSDDLLGYLEENRKISIFDSDFVLEGENNYD